MRFSYFKETIYENPDFFRFFSKARQFSTKFLTARRNSFETPSRPLTRRTATRNRKSKSDSFHLIHLTASVRIKTDETLQGFSFPRVPSEKNFRNHRLFPEHSQHFQILRSQTTPRPSTLIYITLWRSSFTLESFISSPSRLPSDRYLFTTTTEHHCTVNPAFGAPPPPRAPSLFTSRV